MNTYAKRKLKYSWNENFNLLHYVKWDRIVTLTDISWASGFLKGPVVKKKILKSTPANVESLNPTQVKCIQYNIM